MNLQREKYYKEFVRRESDIYRAPYNPELEFYSEIKNGNVEKVKELCKDALIDKPGLGTLSLNSAQNMKYHFAITTAMVARYCIEGGMDLSAAYTLSDFYIQKADLCKTAKEVSDLHPVMCEDYAVRMKKMRKKKVCSLPIANCLDYIYDHLHTRITIGILAEHVHLNSSYLSRLFKKEMGTSVSEYIQEKKIETSKNMLIYSDFSIAEIASVLAFPSQSYYTKVFRDNTGMTPSYYRTLYFRNIEIGKESLLEKR